MATLKIKLENGAFAEVQGVQYCEKKEPMHIIANGWDCSIKEDGTVFCESSKEYSDGVHTMRYVIQLNGFAKLTLKRPRSKVETLRKGFVIPKGAKLSEGLLGLAGGYIDERYAYFRDGSFQKFLDNHGISAVKRENPNRSYRLRSAEYGGGKCRSSIYTDGKVEKKEISGGRTERWQQEIPNTCAYEDEITVEVTGATWVLHKQSQHEGDRCNGFSILYTMKNDPTQLVGLPNKES